MIDFLKELKKFNITYVELSHYNFNKESKSCIFHEEIKELILKQEDYVEKKYFLNHVNENNFSNQIIYSNKNNTVIYRPQIQTLSVFDNNFDFLFEFHSDHKHYDNTYISGPSWVSEASGNAELNFVFSKINDTFFHFKLHDRHNNQITCKPSSQINKICLFILKEDHIQVNFHLSVIKNMIFNLDGSIKSINLLDRVSNDVFLGQKSYQDIIRRFENDTEFHSLCTETSFTMMSEEIFNKNLEFILKVINQYSNIIKKYRETNNIIHNIINHFANLEIMESIKRDRFFLKNKKLDYTNLLKNTSYNDYSLIKDQESIESKTLLFLALMEVKNLNMNNILNPKILNEIQFVNDTAKIITKSDTLLTVTKLKKKKSINNILNSELSNEIQIINQNPKTRENIALETLTPITKIKKTKI